eukprot:Amastigsp_a513524_13.p5 type:complete len:150 gc:universal Amastigsp_a513524_13:873-1322(+)
MRGHRDEVFSSAVLRSTPTTGQPLRSHGSLAGARASMPLRPETVAAFPCAAASSAGVRGTMCSSSIRASSPAFSLVASSPRLCTSTSWNRSTRNTASRAAPAPRGKLRTARKSAGLSIGAKSVRASESKKSGSGFSSEPSARHRSSLSS